MKPLSYLAALACCLTAAMTLTAADQPSLEPQLEPLRPLLDKTWKGAFKNSKPDKPLADVMRWERALNGKAVRVLHSVNDGVYGGETVFMWDEKKQVITFHYFTTAGFVTVGTLTSKDGKFTGHELVSGSADGVTEVRSTCEFLPDGAFRVKSEYLKNGEWQPGREVDYKQDSAAKVIFK
jgi:hypothetical protein